MTATGMVLGDENVAWVKRERFAASRCELENTGERNHILRNGIVMPVECRMRRRFLELDRQHVDQGSGFDRSLLHV